MRTLISAGFIGSGVGLALGAVYLCAGLGGGLFDQGRAEQVAETAAALRAGPDSAGLALALAAPAVAVAQAAVQPDPAPVPVAERVAAPKSSRARELECLTQAIYFEARGESHRGQQAVATVIMNRVNNPRFPSTVCGVVYQGANHRNGCQFSFACDGMVERVVESGAWERARKVAGRALAGAVLRDVGSATHFHTVQVSPAWGAQMLRTAQVGLHVFYRPNPHPQRKPAPQPDNPVVFASATPAQPVELRLASAVLAPADDAAAPLATAPVAAAPRPAAPHPALKPELKPAPRLELPAPATAAAASAPLAKADVQDEPAA